MSLTCTIMEEYHSGVLRSVSMKSFEKTQEIASHLPPNSHPTRPLEYL
jgi:hypothetical protein